MMHIYSVEYEFTQHLKASAQEAFEWCTDYKPYDLSLMKENGLRKIRKITKDAFLLTESISRNHRTIRKTKLVRLNRAGLSWTNTHLNGPNRNSQFLYQILPLRKNLSRLRFKGLLIVYSKGALDEHALRQIAKAEKEADSRAWRFLATAMSNDLRGTH